jgi:hypothetical protein
MIVGKLLFVTDAASEYPIRRYEGSGGIQLVAEVGGNPSAPLSSFCMVVVRPATPGEAR